MTRLIEYRIWPLRIPLTETIDMSFARLQSRPCLLLELVDSDGCVGFGESWVNFPPWSLVDRAVTLDRIVREFVGRPLPCEPGAWLAEVDDRLGIQALQSGTTVPLRHALSALDLALWDLAARRASVSLTSLLAIGQQRQRVPVYASGLGPKQVASAATAALAAGHDAVKLRVGFGRDIDRANLTAARSVLGQGRGLMVDANQAFSPATLLTREADFAAAGVAWIEEPLRADDRQGYRQLRAASRACPLAGGENWYGADLSAAIEEAWVDIIQPDVTKTGGISTVRTALDLATRSGRAISLHVFGSPVGLMASMALAAADPGVCWVEMEAQMEAVWGRWFTGLPATVEGASVLAPRGPGLGVEPHARLVACLVEELRSMVRMPDRTADSATVAN